jgi:DNA-directed RNA polymerase specialized sigma subunit
MGQRDQEGVMAAGLTAWNWSLKPGSRSSGLDLSLRQERRLIAQAQKGSRKCRDEIVMRHLGFVAFRVRRKIYPSLLRRYGEDIYSAAIPILFQKLKTYNLHYHDDEGKRRPVRFASYIWKRIDGFVIDSIRNEVRAAGMGGMDLEDLADTRSATDEA